MRVGEWWVDFAAGEISRQGTVVRLDRETMRLLCYLAQHPGEVISAEELEEQLGSDAAESTGLVRAIFRLRRCLNDDPNAPEYIASVPERGYRLVAPVEIVDGTPLEPPDALLAAALQGDNRVSSPRIGRIRGRASWKTRLTVAAVLILIGYAVTRLAASL
jgi:transcriptional activator of cad operon